MNETEERLKQEIERLKQESSHKRTKYLSMALIFGFGVLCEYFTGNGLGFALAAIIFIV